MHSRIKTPTQDHFPNAPGEEYLQRLEQRSVQFMASLGSPDAVAPAPPPVDPTRRAPFQAHGWKLVVLWAVTPLVLVFVLLLVLVGFWLTSLLHLLWWVPLAVVWCGGDTVV